MRAIDTNVLVRLVARDHPQQAAAAYAFVQGGAWVSVLALAEAIGVLAAIYGRNASELVAALDVLLDLKDLVFQDYDVVSAAVKLFRAKPSVGFSDCLLLELARKAGHLPLATFDRDLAKLQGAQKLSGA